MRRAAPVLLALFLLTVWRSEALGTGVVVLTDSRVAQYREALAAAREVLHAAPVLEVGDEDLAQKLEHAEPAVVLAIGQRALLTAQRASVPVVFCMVLSASAIAARNVTGLKLEVAPNVQLDLLRRVNPQARRFGVIYDPRTFGAYLQEAYRAAAARGLKLIGKPVEGAREVRAAASEMAGDIDALWLLPDPQLINADMFNFLLIFTLERKIALFGFFESFTRLGALASVAPDYAAIGQKAARLAAEIAARPPEARLPLPPALPSPGVLTINAKTARELGIDVPAEIQAKAKQVYR